MYTLTPVEAAVAVNVPTITNFIASELDALALDLNKLNGQTVAVHDGPAHADDVVSVALLQVLGADLALRIKTIRSRDPEVLAGTVRVDVGESWLDHHGARMDRETPECGLTRLVRALLNWQDLDPIHRKLLEGLAEPFREISRGDNGQLPGPHLLMGVQSAIAAEAARGGDFDAQFWTAERLAQTLIGDQLTVLRAEARELADAEAILAAQDDPALAVADHLNHQLKRLVWERKLPVRWLVSMIKPGDWRIACAADPNAGEYSPFSSWHLLPENWKALRGAELEAVSGIPGAVFVHAGLFCGAWSTREGALAACRKADEILGL